MCMMNGSVLTLVNRSDDDRDQIVFCARTAHSRVRLAWRVLEPIAPGSVTRIAFTPPSPMVTWSRGASGLRAVEQFGKYIVEPRGETYALRRQGRGVESRFEIVNHLREPDGVVCCLRSDDRVLLLGEAIGFRQRLVLAVPRVLDVFLTRGAVEGERLSCDAIVTELGRIAIRDSRIELRGNLADGYYLGEG